MTHLFIELVFLGVKFFAFCFARLRSVRLIEKSPLFYGVKTTILRVKKGTLMDKTVLNKLKNHAVGLASAALVRVELATEESRLKTKFQSLGQKLYGAVQDDLLKAIKDDPAVVELIGGIEESQKKIAELEKKLSKENVGNSEEA
jgi:hypothetical protein